MNHDGSLTKGKAVYDILKKKIKYNYGVDMSFDMENTLNGYLTKEWESMINSEN